MDVCQSIRTIENIMTKKYRCEKCKDTGWVKECPPSGLYGFEEDMACPDCLEIASKISKKKYKRRNQQWMLYQKSNLTTNKVMYL